MTLCLPSTIRKTLLLITLIFTLFKSYGQNIVIKYDITRDSSFHGKNNRLSRIFFNIRKNKWDGFDPASIQNTVVSRTSYLKAPTLETDIITYNIKDRGVYFIDDISGHQILLDPSLIKDTIRLQASQIHFYKTDPTGDRGTYLNDSITAQGLFNITYPPKYKYIGFFDSLAYLHEELHGMQFGYSFKELKHDLDTYLKGIAKIYKDRVNFLKTFTAQYGIPQSLKLYAQKEIQYSYYNNLLEPLVQWDTELFQRYPPNLQDTINNFAKDINNTDLFKNTSFHRSVLTQYTALINSKQNKGPVNFDKVFLDNVLYYLKKLPNNEPKAYVISWLMQVYSGKADESAVETLYEQYTPDHSRQATNSLIDSVYQAVKHPGFPPQQMLNLSFENTSHVNKTFKELASKKIIVVDCWATWCIPCLNQLPFLDLVIKKYSDRVQFISLSADQNLNKWDSWIAKNSGNRKDILQIHAPGGFQNIFFKKLRINSIPRYLLISSTGEMLNAAMPLPSDTQEFERELDKYLK
ncbi:TlpA disulfide reductase family protein [Mucilaginibacter sp. CAU 1740]|uniref:TlpA family protein disulfide reductase n=1 Tax=Mucilaginibacter sp. CAU 1740 TaxID=3140365 RepID=UPI00325A8AD7